LNDTLLRIQDAVVEGQAGAVEQEIRAAIATGLEPRVILEEGLIAAMTVVGDEFEKGEIYVPEMLVAARAMQAGLSLLKPHLLELGVEPVGKVVIGTVQGDLHDIGKNLVGMMLQGAGGPANHHDGQHEGCHRGDRGLGLARSGEDHRRWCAADGGVCPVDRRRRLWR
jgi:methanogenic corrinoid protein MtbC1